MDRTVEVEIREAAGGREPTLRATILTEGRAASGGLRELFVLGSVKWPGEGIGVLLEHRAEPEVRGHVVRARNGELQLQARATEAIRQAVAQGKRWMSVEFLSREERTTKGGVREILSAFVVAAALVAKPEYDTTAAEIRSQAADIERRARVWL